MEGEEGFTDKLRIILNRVGSDFTEGDISLSKAEETIGKEIFWQVPNDFKAMMGARNAGVPLITHAPKSKVQQSLMDLAQTLCGKNAAAAAAPAKKERRSFFSFR